MLDLNVPGNPVRAAIREIPIVIQDRSFNKDGSLFYPGDRAFFEGLNPGAAEDSVHRRLKKKMLRYRADLES